MCPFMVVHFISVNDSTYTSYIFKPRLVCGVMLLDAPSIELERVGGRLQRNDIVVSVIIIINRRRDVIVTSATRPRLKKFIKRNQHTCPFKASQLLAPTACLHTLKLIKLA